MPRYVLIVLNLSILANLVQVINDNGWFKDL